MGTISRQTIKGTIYTYLGAVLGFINIAILMQYFLVPDEIGLLSLLIALSVIFAQFSSLGFNQVTTRLFSYFRNYDAKHNGFLFLAVSTALLGFILMMVIFIFLKPYLISRNADKSPLFVEYILLLIPLIFFNLFFNIFDNYNKVLYNSTLGIFIKEVLLRILIFIGLILYAFNILIFKWFVMFYVISQCLPAILLLGYLIRQGQFSLRPDFSFLNKKMKKQIFGVAVFGLLSSVGTVAATNIDKYMVNNYMDLSYTGIYSIAFYFGTLILLPSRSLIKVSSVVIADAWKNKDEAMISKIYQKSCLNQFLIALLLLLLLALNMHNILKFLKPAYSAGVTVIILIGIANMTDMLSGTSGMIIQTSRYYPVFTYIRVMAMVILISFQVLLIPRYGINGAAWAFLITKILVTLIKFSYLFIRFKMQPYNINFLLVIGAGTIAFITGMFFPRLDHYILDLIIRTALMVCGFFAFSILTNVSEEINNFWSRLVKFVRNI